eukprot:678261-Prymnesium_polylepis.1
MFAGGGGGGGGGGVRQREDRFCKPKVCRLPPWYRTVKRGRCEPRVAQPFGERSVAQAIDARLLDLILAVEP